jgi:hypothetical protein
LAVCFIRMSTIGISAARLPCSKERGRDSMGDTVGGTADIAIRSRLAVQLGLQKTCATVGGMWLFVTVEARHDNKSDDLRCRKKKGVPNEHHPALRSCCTHAGAWVLKDGVGGTDCLLLMSILFRGGSIADCDRDDSMSQSCWIGVMQQHNQRSMRHVNRLWMLLACEHDFGSSIAPVRSIPRIQHKVTEWMCCISNPATIGA